MLTTLEISCYWSLAPEADEMSILLGWFRELANCSNNSVDFGVMASDLAFMVFELMSKFPLRGEHVAIMNARTM